MIKKRLFILFAFILSFVYLFGQKAVIVTYSKGAYLKGKVLKIYKQRNFFCKDLLLDSLIIGNHDTLLLPIQREQYHFFSLKVDFEYNKGLIISPNDTLKIIFHTNDLLIKQTRSIKNKLFDIYENKFYTFHCDYQTKTNCYFSGLDSIFSEFKLNLNLEYEHKNINSSEFKMINQSINYYVGTLKLMSLTNSSEYWRMIHKVTKPNLELNNLNFTDNIYYYSYLQWRILENVKYNEKYIKDKNLYLVRKLFDDLVHTMHGEPRDLAIAILLKESMVKLNYNLQNYKFFMKLYSDYKKVCTNKIYYEYHFKDFKKAYKIK